MTRSGRHSADQPQGFQESEGRQLRSCRRKTNAYYVRAVRSGL